LSVKKKGKGYHEVPMVKFGKEGKCFFNVAARKKFLKRNKYAEILVDEIRGRIAFNILEHPSLNSFKLSPNNKKSKSSSESLQSTSLSKTKVYKQVMDRKLPVEYNHKRKLLEVKL
jgi:hypothetical protein